MQEEDPVYVMQEEDRGYSISMQEEDEGYTICQDAKGGFDSREGNEKGKNEYWIRWFGGVPPHPRRDVSILGGT
jgi:hypothetical protein